MNKRKTIIITGAARGIGRTMTALFAMKGYNVIVNYNRSLEKAQLLHKKLKSKGFSVELFQADISKRAQVDAMVDYCINQFGKVDILINNAGISQQKVFTDISEDEWDYMINVNLKGVFNCTQSVLKHMIREKNGKIINISSIWGMVGASCEVHYSSAKSGVIGFTKALSKELGP
jgi:3-oxoacyl-[acyl-carrier protein] reductase